MDGNVVRPLLRKTTEWRKMGIVMARRIAIANPRGDGLRRACTKSCTAAMIFWMADVLLVELSPKPRSVGVVLCNIVGKASDQVRIACTFVPTNPLLHTVFSWVLSLAPYASAGDLLDTICKVSSIVQKTARQP
jgi:hypothetical protein